MKKDQWFQKGADALLRRAPNLQNYYCCPLCLEGFPRELIDQLTFEHVPPRALGGKKLVLTCLACNAKASGKDGVDTHAKKEQNVHDFALGTSEKYHRIKLTTEEITTNAEIHSHGGLLISGLPANNDPTQQKALAEVMEQNVAPNSNITFNIELFRDEYQPRKAIASWLRAGYLAAFTLLGYRYILRRTLDVVRAQINSPDEETISVYIIRSPKEDKKTRSIFLVSEPDWVKGIAIQMGRQIILLPYYDNDGTFYDRLKLNAQRDEAVNISGNQGWEWPTEPTFQMDFFDNPDIAFFHRELG